MPTNEERREIAEEMKERMRERYGFTGINIAEELGIHDDDYDDPYLFDDDCWQRLADLIEPEPERTCTITHAVFNEGDPTGEYEAWNCSHCGELPYDDADSFSYCPCCGTKVSYSANE